MDTFFPALPELPETVTFDGVGLLLLCIGLVLLLSGINAIRVKSDKVEIANKRPSAIAGLILTLVGLGLIAYPEPGSVNEPDTETQPTEIVIVSPTPLPEDPIDVDPTSTPESPENTSQLLGRDIFNTKCLDNALWDPIANVTMSSQVGSSGQACLDMLDWGISLDDTTLEIYLDASTNPGLYGIKAPLPTDSYVELSIQIANLKNGQLRFGILGDSESLKEANGAFAEIQSNGRIQLLWVKEGLETKMTAYSLEENPEGILQFIIEIDGNELLIQQVGVTEEYQKMSLPFSSRHLFLGYENSGRGDINVRYFDLVVEER